MLPMRLHCAKKSLSSKGRTFSRRVLYQCLTQDLKTGDLFSVLCQPVCPQLPSQHATNMLNLGASVIIVHFHSGFMFKVHCWSSVSPLQNSQFPVFLSQKGGLLLVFWHKKDGRNWSQCFWCTWSKKYTGHF